VTEGILYDLTIQSSISPPITESIISLEFPPCLFPGGNGASSKIFSKS
jgi:hypothetical protein